MSNPYKTIYELRETIAELSERCREQEADIEELLKEREWISVNDRLPEIGEEVLIAFSDGDLMVGELLPDGQGFANPYELVNYKITTHWMPLSEPPESEGDADD